MPPHLQGLDAQLVGDGHEHFEDGHEGGDLAEVAAADHLGVDLQAPLVVLARHAAADLVEPVQDAVRERLLPQFVIQVSQAFACVIKFPLCLRVSCRELAALHQAVEGGPEHHVFSGDFFLLHLLCRQLLHAGLLGGSGGDLGVVAGLRGLHWESHHWSRDGGWWCVVFRDLLLPGSASYCRRVIPAFMGPCRRRGHRRGREGLYSRSSGPSLWVPRSKRGIGTRCHGWCRPLVVEATWVHGDWGPRLGAG